MIWIGSTGNGKRTWKLLFRLYRSGFVGWGLVIMPNGVPHGNEQRKVSGNWVCIVFFSVGGSGQL